MELYTVTVAICIAMAVLTSIKNGPLQWFFALLKKFFNLPTAQINKVEQALEDRKQEGIKRCECCEAMVKESDVMCRNCKLEISLGRK